MDTSDEAPSSGTAENEKPPTTTVPLWQRVFGGKSGDGQTDPESSYRPTSTLGILSDKRTDEVPGELTGTLEAGAEARSQTNIHRNVHF